MTAPRATDRVPPDARAVGRVVNQLSRRGLLGLGGMFGLASLVACTEDKDSGNTTAAQAKTMRAAYSTLGAGSGSTWEARGVDTAKLFGDLLGVEVVVFDGKFSPEKQRRDMEQIASQNFDFVAVHAGAINAFVDPAKSLLGKGVPVIQMDTKIADDAAGLDVTTFIEPDNIYMGETMASLLFQEMGGSGEVIHTQGQLTHTGAQLRGEGFKRALTKFPGIKVVDESPGNWSADETLKLWQNLLVKYPNAKGGYFHNDDMALAAYRAAKAAGKESQVKLVGIDGMQPACDAVAKGELLASVVNPTGRIHGTAMWIGYLLKSKKITAVPKYIRADGGVIDKKTAAGFKWLGDALLI
jgi:ribose transport system substrate-binding protein